MCRHQRVTSVKECGQWVVLWSCNQSDDVSIPIGMISISSDSEDTLGVISGIANTTLDSIASECLSPFFTNRCKQNVEPIYG